MTNSEETSNGDIEVRAQYDWSATRPSTAVIDTITRVTSDGPTTFGPLYESVDPDALDSLFQSGETEPMTSHTSLSFGFADRQITVRSSGHIIVRAD